MSEILDADIHLTDEEKKLLETKKVNDENRERLKNHGPRDFAIWVEASPGSGVLLQDPERMSKVYALLMAKHFQKLGHKPKVKRYTDEVAERRIPQASELPAASLPVSPPPWRDPISLAHVKTRAVQATEDQRALYKN